MRTACALCLFVLLFAPAASAQQAVTPPPEPFRAETEAVEIDVRVVDETGRLVQGLGADDFEVFEDGVRQTLRVVTPIRVPALPRPRTGISLEADTQSNRVPFDGRVYAIILDDLHIHPLRANRVKAVMRQFVERHFNANDRAAVVATSGRGDAMQELTGSATAILRAVDALQGRRLNSAVIERIDAYFRLRNVSELDDGEEGGAGSRQRTQIADPLEFERVYHARQTLTSLRDVARWLDSVPARRKAIIFVSEGIEYDLRNFVENRFASSVLADLQDAIAGAARSNTSIYAVDPRGLGGMEDEKIELSSLPDDTTELGQGAFANALRLTQENLQVLAEQTGGFALVNTNDLAGGFDRLVRDNSEYYVLGYESTNPKRDGRFRRVEVRVTRPGVRVVSRRGYYARKDDARPPTAAAPVKALLESPLAVPGLPLDSQVAVFRGAGNRGSALITIEVGPGVGFTQENDVHRGRLDVGVIAIDRNGKVAATSDPALHLNLRPQTRQRADEHGIRMTTRLALDPGRYQIRIAVHDRTSGKGGSVLHDLEVPDYRKADLALSQVVVGSVTGLLKATANIDEELRSAVKLPPTTARTFTPGEELSVFAELYDNRQKAREPLTLRTMLTDETGQVAFRIEERLDDAAFDPERRVYRHRADIPLKDVAPGKYVIRVAAHSGGPAAQPVVREIPLEIESDRNTTH